MDEIRVNDLASRFAAICGEAHVEAGDGIGPGIQPMPGEIELDFF